MLALSNLSVKDTISRVRSVWEVASIELIKYVMYWHRKRMIVAVYRSKLYKIMSD